MDNSNLNQEVLNRRKTDVIPTIKWVAFLRRRLSLKTSLGILLIYLGMLSFYYTVLKEPVDFPAGRIITLEEGLSLKEAGEVLEDQSLVRSATWLRNFVIFFSGEKGVIAGDYFFEEPVTLITIAKTITDKNYRMEPQRITIPEGYLSSEMAEVYSSKLARFDKDIFLEKAAALEGYLFPDTYFFLPTASEDVVIKSMQDNFYSKIEPIKDAIEQSEYSLSEIITMASILELEGKTKDSREVIAGILWKRLEIGMPLQVDASFIYISGKGTSEITVDDLKSDSPFNTYKFKGLPPSPISNPGLESILAALNPKESDYLYYLSDKDGHMYYAKDFETHKKNKALYID